MSSALSLDLRDPRARPYFLWDEPNATVASFREALARSDEDEKARLLGKLMREARDEDVWMFTTVTEVRALLPKIERYLGKRRAFWGYLLEAWQRHGLA
jgi:hypothetical protein